MLKKFLGAFIDFLYSVLCLTRRYMQFYVCLIALAAFHIALPDSLTQVLFSKAGGTAEILEFITSGNVNSVALNAWSMYIVCLVLLNFFSLTTIEIPTSPASSFGESLSRFLIGRRKYTLPELLCSFFVVNIAFGRHSPLCFHDIFCFMLFWPAAYICFSILADILKLDSAYFGCHSDDGKDITKVSDDTYQMLCIQYLSLYDQSEKTAPEDADYALCHAQLRAVRAVLTTIGFKEDDFERIESENNADKN